MDGENILLCEKFASTEGEQFIGFTLGALLSSRKQKSSSQNSSTLKFFYIERMKKSLLICVIAFFLTGCTSNSSTSPTVSSGAESSSGANASSTKLFSSSSTAALNARKAAFLSAASIADLKALLAKDSSAFKIELVVDVDPPSTRDNYGGAAPMFVNVHGNGVPTLLVLATRFSTIWTVERVGDTTTPIKVLTIDQGGSTVSGVDTSSVLWQSSPSNYDDWFRARDTFVDMMPVVTTFLKRPTHLQLDSSARMFTVADSLGNYSWDHSITCLRKLKIMTLLKEIDYDLIYVGAYEGSSNHSISANVPVTLDYATRPVVLALSNYESINWGITKTAQTNLLATFAFDYDSSTVTGVSPIIIQPRPSWNDIVGSQKTARIDSIAQTQFGRAITVYKGDYTLTKVSIP